MSVKLDRARTELVLRHKFAASILLQLEWVEVAELGPLMPFPTMATDGRRLYFHPDFIEQCTVPELCGTLFHETCHVTGLHMTRRKHRNPAAWNIATDAIINHIVGEIADLTLPDGSVPPCEEDITPEQLYDRWEQDGTMDRMQQQYGMAHGIVFDADLSATDRQRLKGMIAAAAQAAQRAGQMTAGLQRYVDRALQATVPWQALLARWMGERVRRDYSFGRINRRHLMRGFMLPDLDGQAWPKVVTGLDTSGSIDLPTLQRIVAEIADLLGSLSDAALLREYDVLWFDADVYPQRITDASELRPQGGGGTMFSPVMRWVREHADEDTKGLVMVTDGWCDDFGPDPGLPVLWILTAANPQFRPPFGEVAHVIN